MISATMYNNSIIKYHRFLIFILSTYLSNINTDFPHRDPIRMEGDMGTEYNCLYTTKELTCKDRVSEFKQVFYCLFSYVYNSIM